MKCALALAVLLGGCVSAPGLSRERESIPPGQWGGDQIALDVSADSRGHVELSCASAEFTGPVKLGVGGHFLTRAGSFQAPVLPRCSRLHQCRRTSAGGSTVTALCGW